MAEQDFEKLLTTITKLNDQISRTGEQVGKLEGKIQGFQAKIAEGGLGTFQVKELESQISSLTAKVDTLREKISTKQGKAQALLNKDEVDEYVRSAGEAAKAVDTIKKNLEALSRDKGNLAKVPSLLPDIEKTIKAQQAALGSMESRLRNISALVKEISAVSPTPVRPRSTDADVRRAGVVDDSYLKASIPATPQTYNPEYQEGVRKKGLEIALRTLDLIQAEMIKGALAAAQTPKTSDANVLNQPLNRLMSSYIKGQLESLNLPKFVGNTSASQSKIFPPNDPLSPLKYVIHHPGEGGTDDSGRRPASEHTPQNLYNDKINTAQAEYLKMIEAAIKVKSNENARDIKHLQALTAANEQELAVLKDSTKAKQTLAQQQKRALDKALKAEQESQRALETEQARQEFAKSAEGQIRGGLGRTGGRTETKTELLAKEQEILLQTLRGRVQSEERYKSVLDAAAKQGYTINDLKYGRTRGSAGIENFRFEKEDDTGVKQQLDLFNTKGGKTTAGISNQFRTFGQGIVRDIGELTKWSIALAAVYGPMRKLQELTQEMIENQTKLAEATIVVSSSFLTQSKIFDIAADAANKSGEAISGVIDAFTLAYRATGGAADQVKRLADAQTLLSNALVLSKLSSLDQASAIDTLAAAVRQSGGDFNKSTELLDSWVRVTKVANVDLATLATGFATVADAADNVGLKADELNGILATLAESTNQSGQEVANTSRAIISGFQSDQGIKALESLGIATQDTVGNMRSLKDVMTEVASLTKQGVISPTQLAELSLAIGGGSRRQAAVTTFISNYDRAMQVAEESSRANGDAQAALAKQMDTVQTSLTKLANSFTTLAQILGTEGGFLSIIQGSVESMTSLVGVFDKLISLLGKATPAMAAFIAASVVLKAKGQGGLQQALFGAGNQINAKYDLGNEYGTRLAAVTGNPQGAAGGREKAGGLVSTLTGSGAIGGAFQGLLLSAIPAIMNATNKEDRFGGTKAVADVTGGLVGGIVGSFTVAGPLIGAAVGTAIAESFVNATIARKTDIFGYGQTPTLGAKTTPLGTSEDRTKALEEATIGLYKSVGGGSEQVGRFITSGSEKLATSLVDQINEVIKDQDKEKLNNILNRTNVNSNYNAKDVLKGAGISEDFIRSAFAGGQQVQASGERAAYLRASPEAQKTYDAILATITATDNAKAGIDTEFTKQTVANKQQYGGLVSGISTQSKTNLAGQRLTGDVTGAEYARRYNALGGFDTKSLQFYTAFGKEFEKVNTDINNATDSFNAFNEVIVTGAENSVPELTAMVGQIEDLTNALADPNLQKDPEVFKTFLQGLGVQDLAGAQRKLQEYKDTAANIITDVYRQVQLTNVKVPQIEGDINKPLTTGENTLVEQRTKQLQDSFYQGFLKIPDEMYDAMKASWEDFAVTIKDSGDEFYKSVTETDQQFRAAAVKQLEEEGKIKSQKENPFGIQQLDITSQQGAGLQGKIDYFSKYLSQNFPQYKQNPEDIGVIYSDYITDVLHGDNLAMKLALEKIVDLNQKQLDGMYNIPEGATFWVPLTAAYYKPKNEGQGGINMPEVKGVEDNTQATQLNTQALMNMTDKWNNADPFLFKRPGNPKEDRYDKMNEVKEPITKFAPGGLANPMPRYVTNKDERYDKMQTQAPPETLIDKLLNGLRSFFGIGGDGGGYKGFGKGLVPGPLDSGVKGIQQLQAVAPTVQARMDLRFENSTQLLVDGRILASVITPYLSSDLIKFEASQGTITKRYVI
jgi:TP901 family phage tail tape measure protein